jgi:hypothetical protein
MLFVWLVRRPSFLFEFSQIISIHVEHDSLVFYLLVKRLIHQTFSIIILACYLLHLGRVHLPLLIIKVNNNEF